MSRLGPDETLYCADDKAHCIHRFTLDGRLLSTIGAPGQGSPLHSGLPFNLPTKLAIDPHSGDLYISDGYGNARVHKYTADGRYLFSWGEFGSEAGQFNLVHSVCTDSDGKVYIADRENHRVQIFAPDGAYLGQWTNMHRPCGLYFQGDLAYHRPVADASGRQRRVSQYRRLCHHPRSDRPPAWPGWAPRAPAKSLGSSRRPMAWPSIRGATCTWARSLGAPTAAGSSHPRLMRSFRKLVKVS